MIAIIFKHPLPLLEEFALSLPRGAKVLCVQEQRGLICLWERHHPQLSGSETRHFSVIGTGHVYHDNQLKDYIGTVQLGEYVWHVFEVLPV